jgi:hypothetical protein
MKKFVASVLALAALSGFAIAGEREHDSRLANPSYGETVDGVGAPQFLVNKFASITSDAGFTYDEQVRRLEEKNGSKG